MYAYNFELGPPKSPFFKGRFRGNVNISPSGMHRIPEFKSRIQLKKKSAQIGRPFLYCR